ncbi:MAG: selenocysteine-specific translation elongation factor [Candidatus Promineifilaceae bacterium]|nr:selenocysteine-specific translation elongation factor [Candidatus Promineifilaceae bacterium]
MYVIGTAGHVDHGKSTLVEALSGIDPDRLAEEKERQMTIDLGFAWVRLGEEEALQEVGIVDVPGHRDFIENMLAGVGGIDLALLVVAADEGVMPQTREHLAILDLLQVPAGVVALSRVDLVDDPEWLERVTLDVQDTVAGTALSEAPIVPVSAVSGEGLDLLRATLASSLLGTPGRADSGQARLPVDRVFSLSGFGTIITGTLTGGSLEVGDAVEIQPGGLSGRVRGLQSHNAPRERALPGSRVAVNVSNIGTEEIERGDVMSTPGLLRGSTLLDATYRHLSTAGSPLRHNQEVKLFVGAAEVIARTRVIGTRAIEPGSSGWLQLALADPVAVMHGDRYILRWPSPPETIGGGRIVDPHPGRRHRRFRPEVNARFETLERGAPADVLLQRLEREQPILLSSLLRRVGLTPAQAEEAWRRLADEARVRSYDRYALTAQKVEALRLQLLELLAAYHEAHPLRAGMPREEVRSRLDLPGPLFSAFLEEVAQGAQRVRDTGHHLRLPDHAIRFTDAQQARVDRLLADFEAAGVSSPSVRESREAVGKEVYDALLELGYLQQLNEEVVYTSEQLTQLRSRVIGYLEVKGAADAATVRDLLQTSRKYAIALLEHLDQEQITRREGDIRRLVGRMNKRSGAHVSAPKESQK